MGSTPQRIGLSRWPRGEVYHERGSRYFEKEPSASSASACESLVAILTRFRYVRSWRHCPDDGQL
jgi:hypothetical protein